MRPGEPGWRLAGLLVRQIGWDSHPTHAYTCHASLGQLLQSSCFGGGSLRQVGGGKESCGIALGALMPSGVDLMRHVEPFMGGGAMFFARAPERALLCDINPDLVRTYKHGAGPAG